MREFIPNFSLITVAVFLFLSCGSTDGDGFACFVKEDCPDNLICVMGSCVEAEGSDYNADENDESGEDSESEDEVLPDQEKQDDEIFISSIMNNSDNWIVRTISKDQNSGAYITHPDYVGPEDGIMELHQISEGDKEIWVINTKAKVDVFQSFHYAVNILYRDSPVTQTVGMRFCLFEKWDDFGPVDPSGCKDNLSLHSSVAFNPVDVILQAEKTGSFYLGIRFVLKSAPLEESVFMFQDVNAELSY